VAVGDGVLPTGVFVGCDGVFVGRFVGVMVGVGVGVLVGELSGVGEGVGSPATVTLLITWPRLEAYLGRSRWLIGLFKARKGRLPGRRRNHILAASSAWEAYHGREL
jgi:hypothetical protein